MRAVRNGLINEMRVRGRDSLVGQAKKEVFQWRAMERMKVY